MATLTKTPKGLTLDNNTASKVVKDNPTDKIQIEIGDSKQPDFKPQMKIIRWDNEVNFSLRAEEDPTATVETDGNVIKYKTKDYEVHQYEKPEASEDGGFEFEWVLPKKPKTNVLTGTIQTKGLDFFYQPALTKQEIKDGAERPDNVVGSYAVYHSTKGGMNDATGMEYKTGKAFHIYRPKAVDADGNEAWAELNIDTDSGLLTVTVPQSFLDNAVYPLVVDPTFGYTSVGSSFNQVIPFSTGHGNIIAGKFTMDNVSGQVVSSMTFYAKGSRTNGAMEMAIYNSSADTLIGQTNQISSITLDAWNTAAFASSPSVSQLTDYYLSVWGVDGDNASQTSIALDTTGGTAIKQANVAGYDTWPSSITGAQSYHLSIYATYTAAPTGYEWYIELV